MCVQQVLLEILVWAEQPMKDVIRCVFSGSLWRVGGDFKVYLQCHSIIGTKRETCSHTLL